MLFLKRKRRLSGDWRNVLFALYILFILNVITTPSLASNDCGDVYPSDSFPGALDCGDGVVDLFDIMEEIDILLGVVSPTICQSNHGNMPNGIPPYCGDPPGTDNCDTDDDLDIFDTLIIIDKALGKTNCCSFCFDVACNVNADCDDGNDCTDDKCNNNVCTNSCNATDSEELCCMDPVCYSEYICGGNIACTIRPENKLVGQGGTEFEIDLCLDNQNDDVRSVQLDICETIDGSPIDYLECVGCTTTDRSIDFSCSANELSDGCCRVLLFNIGTNVIYANICSIINVDYSLLEDNPFTECITLVPSNVLISDSNNTELGSAGLTGEVCFTDFDGDGILNHADNCPGRANASQSDEDVDTLGDICDDCTDTDGDGYGDPGFPANSCPLDNCPDVTNPGQEDLDVDTLGDICDDCTDTDGDGYGDPGFPANSCPLDNCPDETNAGQEDLDGDALGDICDDCTDTDGDGYGDPGFTANSCPLDNCPDETNPGQEDLDGDALGDICDDCTDTDGDGYGDPGFTANICSLDNCPDETNPGQEDLDGDALGDICDDCTDTDGDGYGDPGFPANICSLDNCPDETNPGQEDLDGDALGDICDDCTDTDGDGYGDPGFTANSCPLDNCPDVTNPGQEDLDGDALGDICDSDDDNDAIPDNDDMCPFDPFNDTDDDDVCDNIDNCPKTQNGPRGGTCTKGNIRTACMSDIECGDAGVCSMNQEDTYPLGGNSIGDACDCEGDFDCDGDCDGTDVAIFKMDFGRSLFENPCNNVSPCKGDFDCDNDCDGLDAALFKLDFGRSEYLTPCPACNSVPWCVYP